MIYCSLALYILLQHLPVHQIFEEFAEVKEPEEIRVVYQPLREQILELEKARKAAGYNEDEDFDDDINLEEAG